MNSGTTPRPAIRLSGLSKAIRTGFWGRKKQLLTGIDISVPAGTVFGFVGPNGAGKSTTIKCMIGALRPSAGEVRLAGLDPADPKGRVSLGYLAERQAMPATLTGREWLGLHAALVDEPISAVDAVLERVGMAARADVRLGSMSKGMQQRIALGAMLLGDPEILVMDEPMSGLDPIGRDLVRGIIRAHRERGGTVFFSSHVLSDVTALCDALGLIVDGHLVRTGSIADVLGADVDALSLLFNAPETALQSLAEHYTVERVHADARVTVAPRNVAEATAAIAAAGGTLRRVESAHALLEERLLQLVQDARESRGGNA